MVGAYFFKKISGSIRKRWIILLVPFCFAILSQPVIGSLSKCFTLILSTPETSEGVVTMIKENALELTRAEIKGLLEIYGLSQFLVDTRIQDALANRDNEVEFMSAVNTMAQLLDPRSLRENSSNIVPILAAYLREVLDFIHQNINNPTILARTIFALDEVQFQEGLEKTMIIADSLPDELGKVIAFTHDTLSRHRARYRYTPISAHEVDEALEQVNSSLSFIGNNFDSESNEVLSRIYQEADNVQSLLNNQGMMWHALRSRPREYIASLRIFRDLLPNLARISKPEAFIALVKPLEGLKLELVDMRVNPREGWELVSQNVDKHWDELIPVFTLPPEIGLIAEPTEHKWDPIRQRYGEFFSRHEGRPIYKKIVLEYLRFVLAPGE